MHLKPRDLWGLLRQTYRSWDAHAAPRLGAALAFYALLSIAPLVILTIAMIAMVVGKNTAQDEIITQVQSMIGSQGAEAVRTMIEHAKEPATGAVASLLGILTLLFGASGVFGELRDALNLIWNVKPSSGAGFLLMVKQRFFSFGMVLAIGFLLLISLIVNAAIAAAGKALGPLLPTPEWVLGSLNFLLSFLAVAILFGLIFKYVPDAFVAWHQVWAGALATAFFFSIGKLLIGLYLGKASVGSPYGAAGSLVVIIIWVYYSAQIFFFGAEFTYAYAQLHDRFEEVKLEAD